MNSCRIIGIVLIVGGILDVSFGGFSSTRPIHEAKLGPIALSISEKESVNVPLWASIAAIAASAGLPLVGA